MKKIAYLKISLLILLTIHLLVGCGKDSPISWSRVRHDIGDRHILTISELIGPNRARIGNIIPGKYIAKGTYDLTGTSFTTGEIRLGFSDSYTFLGEGQKNYIIPDGQLSGNYEVILELYRLNSGPGNPCVDFVVGSTMYDRIKLY